MSSEEEIYLTVKQAAKYLAISRTTLFRLISNGTIKVTPNPLDKRVKLLRKSDLDKMKLNTVED